MKKRNGGIIPWYLKLLFSSDTQNSCLHKFKEGKNCSRIVIGDNSGPLFQYSNGTFFDEDSFCLLF